MPHADRVVGNAQSWSNAGIPPQTETTIIEIMLTALNQQKTVVKAIQPETWDFFTRPAVPTQLMTTLQDVLR